MSEITTLAAKLKAPALNAKDNFNPNLQVDTRDLLMLVEALEGYKAAYEEEVRDKEVQRSVIDDALCKLLPGCQYMDPPDGGSVTPLEQVSRMVEDYRQRIEGITQNPVAWQLVDVITSEVFVCRDLDKVNAFLKENQWLEVSNLYDHPSKTLTVHPPKDADNGIGEIWDDGYNVGLIDYEEALRAACAAAGIKLQIEE
ncbi:hypothetical protein CHU32_27835 [Superficieibacter electus]|uniref:Uncharacterized protein n=1 Tax=Superficieibacter electus TaxID=2022662 RepID=A0A2P5GGI4_9ENTR|nr:hypothetical protein [Superficieibacter electus]POP40358.1 hypothetical protein CHU33_27805 [Superficieibacter electus]POP40540.1 hypothetical protein CHU32_27835 [Superficieibacter electus]